MLRPTPMVCFRMSIISVEALCWEVCMSAALFLSLSFRFFFFFLCQLTNTPIPGISGGFTDINVLIM